MPGGPSMAGKAQLSAFVVVLALSALAPPALAQTCAPPAPDKGQDHIWLYPQTCGPATSAGACYSVSGATDPWKDESYQQTGGTSLDLTIANQDPHENMTCAVLVIAIHGDTTSSHLASLTFEDGSNTTTVPFSQFSQACTIPFSPNQSHGVYPESDPTTIWATYQVPSVTPDSPILALTSRVVHVTADTDGTVSEIHFDAYDCNGGNTNPFSHDLNWIGPLPETCTTAPTISCDASQSDPAGATCTESRTLSPTASDCHGKALTPTCTPPTVTVDHSTPIS